MKRLIALLVLGVSTVLMTGCAQEEYKVALVTDKGTINDGSFNEGSWNGILEYCKENDVTHKYYQPAEATDADRWNSVELAVKGGAELVVLPGYLFESLICNASVNFPEVKFLLLDGSYKNDSSFGEVYDSTKSYDNVYCVNYQEEQAGYLAGYAAVMEGDRSLGFMGGVEMPAVVRFGYGYVQGAEQAAIDLGLDNDAITMKYNYVGDFVATPDSNSLMASWFSGTNPTETVFSCGGGIWTSVKDAIAANGYKGKMIGVDVDQYEDGIHAGGNFVITSATKGLANTVITTLETYFAGEWDTVGGEIETLGLGNTTDAVRYVGLPTEGDSWGFKKFTIADYNTLVGKIQSSTYTVNNTIDTTVTTGAGLETLLGLNKVNVTSFTK